MHCRIPIAGFAIRHTHKFRNANLDRNSFDRTSELQIRKSWILKIYRDYKNTIDTTFDEGKIEGKMEGKMEVAKKMKAKGVSVNDIVDLTGLSVNEINAL